MSAVIVGWTWYEWVYAGWHEATRAAEMDDFSAMVWAKGYIFKLEWRDAEVVE